MKRTIYQRLEAYLNYPGYDLSLFLHLPPEQWRHQELRRDCWIWTGPVTQKEPMRTAYTPDLRLGGRFRTTRPRPVLYYNKKRIASVPLFLTKMHKPEITKVTRICRNNLCVNPAHYRSKPTRTPRTLQTQPSGDVLDLIDLLEDYYPYQDEFQTLSDLQDKINPICPDYTPEEYAEAIRHSFPKWIHML